MEIRRACMRDHIRTVIVSRITDGSYPPGTRLKELVLAGEFKTSQAPVREALRELEALGLIASERYRGARVREADNTELAEAYALRVLLEERAAQLAVPCAPAVLDTLRAELTLIRQSFRRKDFDAHADALIRFHRGIVVASGNRAFVAAWDNLHWEVRTRIAVQRARVSGIDLGRFVEGHANVLAALERGDGHAAGAAIREMIESLLAELPRADAAPALSARGARSRGAAPARTVRGR